MCIRDRVPLIRRGAQAELTLFDPDIEWTYKGTKHSQSVNDAVSYTHLDVYKRQLYRFCPLSSGESDHLISQTTKSRH